MAEKEYIEREAALDAVNGWRDQLIPTYGKNDEYVKCLETVAEHLELLHAADVRPVRRGKRIDYQQGRWVYAKCSECETVHDVRSNFCPNCGADMREGS